MPENTLAGFAAALSLGVTTLELDLGVTRDGVVVVSHDDHLNPDHTRSTDGAFLETQGPAIRSLTLAELKRYDVGRLKPGTAYAASLPQQRTADGATIPTLAEVFELVHKSRRITSASISRPRSRLIPAPKSPLLKSSLPLSCATCRKREWPRGSPCSHSTGARWLR